MTFLFVAICVVIIDQGAQPFSCRVTSLSEKFYSPRAWKSVAQPCLHVIHDTVSRSLLLRTPDLCQCLSPRVVLQSSQGTLSQSAGLARFEFPNVPGSPSSTGRWFCEVCRRVTPLFTFFAQGQATSATLAQLVSKRGSASVPN